MKIFKIILINIIFLGIIFVFFEHQIYKEEIKLSPDFFPFAYPYYSMDTNKKWDVNFEKILNQKAGEEEAGFRQSIIDSNTDINKPAILLFGCSYAYGAKLKADETLSYFLSKSSNRIVYNRAYSGWGTQSMLYQLQNPDFISSLKYNVVLKGDKQPDYNNIKDVIYVFMGDHIRRLYISCSFFDDKLLFYKKDKNNNLKRKTNIDNLFWHSYIWRKSYRKEKQKEYSNVNNSSEFLYLHLKESNKKIKEHLPNARFIVFVYDSDYYIRKIENELKKENIEIIYLSDLTHINFYSGEYVIKNFYHPTGKAWAVISKLLMEKLEI